MKKIYFLINVLILFLIPSLVSFSKTNYNINPMINNEEIDISSGQYLNLSYQNGKFYSWNQEDSSDQHIIGVFINDEQSYLLDSSGIFWNLDYQIFNFYRVNNQYAIATIKYFQNSNKNEYFNQSFIIELNNNSVSVNNTPILSKNINFVTLNDTNVLAYGIGLDLINVTDNSVRNLIPPYQEGYFPTAFYPIDSNNGIFVGNDQYYYLLNDITGTLVQTKINLKVPNTNHNVVVINNNNLVIRSEGNMLHFVDVSNGVVINDWQRSSKAINFAFTISSNTFVLNISFDNSSSEGIPYLVKTDDWNNLIAIPNIETIIDFMFINDTNGIFIDKYLQVNTFVYQDTDDFFIVTNIGKLNSFQFVNNTLFFGSIGINNLLITQESNPAWSIISNIKFTTKSIVDNNFLNNMIVTETETINYQNTFFSNGVVNLDITDVSLVEVVINSKTGTRILPAKKNNVNYDFLNFDNYEVTITYSTSTINQSLDFKVNILDYIDKNLLNVSGSNLISYVGASKNNLYDIKVIDQNAEFTINNYDYDYLQYVELYVFEDATNTVVKNVLNLKSNTEIKAKVEEKEFFFGLKMVNLLNQVTWIYLGFSENGVNPMVDFWDTDFGENLMNQALGHRYLERDLRTMNSQQILQLIANSNNWHAIATQGRAIVITIISIFAVALLAIATAIITNIALNKKIEVAEFEKNIEPIKGL